MQDSSDFKFPRVWRAKYIVALHKEGSRSPLRKMPMWSTSPLGAVLANIDGQGQRPQVAWISDGNGGACLVVSSENKLSAFKVPTPVR